jgi:hypothetical protein
MNSPLAADKYAGKDEYKSKSTLEEMYDVMNGNLLVLNKNE